MAEPWGDKTVRNTNARLKGKLPDERKCGDINIYRLFFVEKLNTEAPSTPSHAEEEKSCANNSDRVWNPAVRVCF